MRELNNNEVQVISGAGKIQDTLSNTFGSFFGTIYDEISSVLDPLYTKKEVTSLGTDLGKRIGVAVESHVNRLIDFLSSWSK